MTEVWSNIESWFDQKEINIEKMIWSNLNYNGSKGSMIANKSSHYKSATTEVRRIISKLY